MPSSFRIAAQAALAPRGRAHAARSCSTELHVEIPAQRVAQAKRAAKVLGDRRVRASSRSQPGVQADARRDAAELCSTAPGGRRSSITGADGLPPLARRGQRAAAASRRSSSRCACRRRATPRQRARDGQAACSSATRPTARKVTLRRREGRAPAGTRPSWRRGSSTRSTARRSATSARPACTWARAASIPFMGMLGREVPEGAVPDHRRARARTRNAHGPNEFLHIPTGKRLTAASRSVHRGASTRAASQPRCSRASKPPRLPLEAASRAAANAARKLVAMVPS